MILHGVEPHLEVAADQAAGEGGPESAGEEAAGGEQQGEAERGDLHQHGGPQRSLVLRVHTHPAPGHPVAHSTLWTTEIPKMKLRIFYYGKKLPTPGKLEKIPDLQPPD